MSLDDTIAKNVLNPIEEAWKLTQDKTTSYHQEYVTTYYSLSPYLEEVADAINAWGKMMKEKALETGNKDEKERILGLFNDQMNGSLGAAIKHVVEQMKAVQRKETQYKADVVAAEQTLQEEKPIHSTEESPFEVLDVMMASEREKSDLIKNMNSQRIKIEEAEKRALKLNFGGKANGNLGKENDKRIKSRCSWRYFNNAYYNICRWSWSHEPHKYHYFVCRIYGIFHFVIWYLDIKSCRYRET